MCTEGWELVVVCLEVVAIEVEHVTFVLYGLGGAHSHPPAKPKMVLLVHSLCIRSPAQETGLRPRLQGEAASDATATHKAYTPMNVEPYINTKNDTNTP